MQCKTPDGQPVDPGTKLRIGRTTMICDEQRGWIPYNPVGNPQDDARDITHESFGRGIGGELQLGTKRFRWTDAWREIDS